MLTGSGTRGYSKHYFPRRASIYLSGPSGGNGTATERAGAQGQAMGWLVYPSLRNTTGARINKPGTAVEALLRSIIVEQLVRAPHAYVFLVGRVVKERI